MTLHYYIKVERKPNGNKAVTTGVTRDQLNYNSFGIVLAKYKAVTTDKVTRLYLPYKGATNLPYFG